MNSLRRIGSILEADFSDVEVLDDDKKRVPFESAAAKILLIYLEDLRNQNMKYSWPSYAKIQKAVGCGRTKAINLVKALTILGILEKKGRLRPARAASSSRGRQTSNAYWICWDVLLNYVPNPDPVVMDAHFIEADEEDPKEVCSSAPEEPEADPSDSTQEGSEIRTHSNGEVQNPDPRGSGIRTPGGSESGPQEPAQRNPPTATAGADGESEAREVDVERVLAKAAAVRKLEVLGIPRDVAITTVRDPRSFAGDGSSPVLVLGLIALGMDVRTARRLHEHAGADRCTVAIVNATWLQAAGRLRCTMAGYARKCIEDGYALNKSAKDGWTRRRRAPSQYDELPELLQAYPEDQRLECARLVGERQHLHASKGDPLTTFETQGDWDLPYMAAVLTELDRARALEQLTDHQDTTDTRRIA